MNKKLIFLMILVLTTWCLLNCESVKKPRPWIAVLDENHVNSLAKPIAEIKQHLDAGQQFQKKGQRTRANEEMKLVRQGLEELESYYLPLTNAKARLATAFRLTERKEIPEAIVKLRQVRSDINMVKSQAVPAMQNGLNSLILELESLEKELEKKSSEQIHEKFIKIAEPIDKMIRKTK